MHGKLEACLWAISTLELKLVTWNRAVGMTFVIAEAETRALSAVRRRTRISLVRLRPWFRTKDTIASIVDKRLTFVYVCEH